MADINATDIDTSYGVWILRVSSAAGNGAATVSGSGASPTTFTYQPNANFNGSDSFEVQVSDGNLNDSITINVNVTPVNDPPVITQGVGPLTKTLLEDGNVSWAPAELNATDLDSFSCILDISVVADAC